MRVEAQVHRLQRNKSPHHDAGAGQQDQRECQFDNHQRIPQTAAPEAAVVATPDFSVDLAVKGRRGERFGQ